MIISLITFSLFSMKATNFTSRYKGILTKNDYCRLGGVTYQEQLACLENSVFELFENSKFEESSYSLNYLCHSGNQDACSFITKITNSKKLIQENFQSYNYLDLKSLCKRDSIESYGLSSFYCSKLKDVASNVGDKKLYSELEQLECLDESNHFSDECLQSTIENPSFSTKDNLKFYHIYCSTLENPHDPKLNQYCDQLTRIINVQKKFEGEYSENKPREAINVLRIIELCKNDIKICEKILNEPSFLLKFRSYDKGESLVEIVSKLNISFNLYSGGMFLNVLYPRADLSKSNALMNLYLESKFDDKGLKDNCINKKNSHNCAYIYKSVVEARNHIDELQSFCKNADVSSCIIIKILKSNIEIDPNETIKGLIFNQDQIIADDIEKDPIIRSINYIYDFKFQILFAIVSIIAISQILIVLLLIRSRDLAKKSIVLEDETRNLKAKSKDLEKNIVKKDTEDMKAKARDIMNKLKGK